MTQTNASKFFNELINLYTSVEQAVGAKCAQDRLNEQVAHAISITSIVALGFFTPRNCDHMLLRAGLATGALLSFMPLSETLKKGAILPMDQKGYFALQKVCLLAILLQKNFAFPLGFFAGNAIVHYALSFRATSER